MTDTLPPLPSKLSGAFGRPVWNETRAPRERARLALADVPLADGAGRRVVLATGYMATPSSATLLGDWLRGAGYDVRLAAIGRNMSTSSVAVEGIVASLEASDDPAILIGHSRGGQQCRVATMRRPERVAQLITLGSPVRHHLPRQALLRLSVEGLRLLARMPLGSDKDLDADDVYEQDLYSPFGVDVPWTAIWSKIDGVVEWQACMDRAAESIEVRCSHTGLLASVPSFRAIADVLER